MPQIHLAVLLCVLSFCLEAQQILLPLDQEDMNWQEHYSVLSKSYVNTGFKPVVQSFFQDSGYMKYRTDHMVLCSHDKKWLPRKLFYESAVDLDTGLFKLTIDPLLWLEYDIPLTDDSISLWRNTRGILIRGSIGEKLSFSSSFLENQAFFPDYQREWIAGHNVVPGQGRVKPFKTSGVDFAMSSGYLSYRPFKWFQVNAGHGKNFVGYGYRSLILSDNSFNYPYIRASALLARKTISYTAMWASLQHYQHLPAASTPEALFIRKGLSLQHITFTPWPFVSLSLAEAVIWQRWDVSGTLPFDYSSLVPIPGIQALRFGWDNKNTVVSAAQMRLAPCKNWMLYSQLVYTGDWGYQGGIRIFDLFGYIRNLNILAEYNHSDQFQYYNFPLWQEYSHYNQWLAHPFGNGFDEITGRISYRYKRLNAACSVSYSTILSPVWEFVADPSLSGNLQITSGYLGWMINPAARLQLQAGYSDRFINRYNSSERTTWFWIGLRSDLFNQYTDF